MRTRFIEATNGPMSNWGKFMLCQFDEYEWAQESAIDQRPLLNGRGWDRKHLLVVDLQTGEGAVFLPGGLASYDLKKHAIWVCPMFEPFLEWLYKQDLSDLSMLPAHIDLPEAGFAMAGHRRPGPLDVTCEKCLGLGALGQKGQDGGIVSAVLAAGNLPKTVSVNIGGGGAGGGGSGSATAFASGGSGGAAGFGFTAGGGGGGASQVTCRECRGSGFIPRRDINAEELAAMFHGTYETLAIQFGYETRRDSAVPWEDVPEKNKKLMVATAGAILEVLKARGAKGTEGGQL